jgi:hypothetical protein
MASKTVLYLYNSTGTKLAAITDYASLEYARKVNEVGQMTVDLPLVYRPLFYPGGTFMRDCQLEVWRSVAGQPYTLDMETSWFVTLPTDAQASDGTDTFTVVAQDSMNLLQRRVVDYVAGSSQASKTGTADDNAKAIVTENFVSPTNTLRTMPNLTVAANLTAAPVVAKDFAWRNCFDVIKELANSANTSGTYMAFDVIRTDVNSFQFKTFTGARGTDRSTTLTIDPRLGNLGGVKVTQDFSVQKTAIIAGGQGEGVNRAIQRATDPLMGSYGPYGWIEYFYDSRNSASNAALLADANAQLRASRAIILFNGVVIDIPATQYGVNYFYGDIIKAQKDTLSVLCRLDAVKIKVDGNGEQIDINLVSVV